MTPKFPIWMTIVLGLQMLSTLPLALLLWIFGSMFDGSMRLRDTVLIGIILLLPPLCWWLARRQWGNGHQRAAAALTFMPVILLLALNAIAALMMR